MLPRRDNFCCSVLPAQFYPGRQKFHEGEYRMMVAMLDQAVRSYLASQSGGTSERRKDFKELRRWFYASGTAAPQGPFAFESICESSEIDAEVIRKRLNSISIRAVPMRRDFGRRTPVLPQRRASHRRTSLRSSWKKGENR